MYGRLLVFLDKSFNNRFAWETISTKREPGNGLVLQTKILISLAIISNIINLHLFQLFNNIRLWLLKNIPKTTATLFIMK